MSLKAAFIIIVYVHQVGGIVHRPIGSEYVVCMYIHFLRKACTSVIHTVAAPMDFPCECGALGWRQSSGCVML